VLLDRIEPADDDGAEGALKVKPKKKAASKSSSKTLKILVSPLNKLSALTTAAGNRLKKGQYNPSNISNLSTQTGVFSKLAGGVKDIAAPIPEL